MSLIAELDVPGAPHDFTVVSTHLEDRTRSACRRDQAGALLTQLRKTPGALVIGGDLNTSGTDGTPTSIQYEIKKRVTSPRFWTKQGIRWFTPLAVPGYRDVACEPVEKPPRSFGIYCSLLPPEPRASDCFANCGALNLQTAEGSTSVAIPRAAGTATAARLLTPTSGTGRDSTPRTTWSAPTSLRVPTGSTGCS